MKSTKGFYIGDICYVLNDDLYQNWWGNGYPDKIDPSRGHYDEGEFEDVRGTGYDLAVYGTGIGDGMYHDDEYHEYPVDAGVIGMIPMELIELYPSESILNDDGTVDWDYVNAHLGRVVRATSADMDVTDLDYGVLYEISCWDDEGNRTFIEINTEGDDEEDDW